MRLLTLFLGTIAAVLTPVMLLTWWIDPFGEFYDGGALRAATAGPRPCLISDDLIGGGSWLAFKEDVYRTRRPRTVVLGTSRVLKMGSSPDEREFANLGMPGTGIETLEPLFRHLHERRAGPLTVYIGVELYWFNPSWQPSTFRSSRLSKLRYLLARQNVAKSLTLVVDDPDSLLHRWRRERIGRWCALDRGSRLREGRRYAWQANGSIVYQSEVVGKSVPRGFRAGDLPALNPDFYGDWHEFDLDRLHRLEASLRLARAYGWRVVGFSPPSTARYADLLGSIPQLDVRGQEFGALVPPVFEHQGFAFLDLRRAEDVPCSETSFYLDEWHPKQPCMEAVRRRLDKAAASEEDVP